MTGASAPAVLAQQRPNKRVNEMRLVIFGAGSIGATIGARLYEAGKEVVFIARGRHGERLRQQGLSFVSAAGRRRLRIPTVTHPAALRFRSDDIVLLSVKSQQTVVALEALRAAGGDQLPVICAQNGVANERMALRCFASVYAMVVMLPATHLQPGEVISFAEDSGGILDAGCFPQGVDERITAVCEQLSAAGFSARPDPQVMRLKYAKLLTNLGNAVQALCGRVPEADHAELGARLAAEGLACYAAAGIDCASEAELKERRRPLRLHRLPDVQRQGGSSWQSIARATGEVEADYLNGEIAQLGRLHGVPTPFNVVCQREVQRLARQRGPAGAMALEQLLALVDEQAAVDAG